MTNLQQHFCEVTLLHLSPKHRARMSEDIWPASVGRACWKTDSRQVLSANGRECRSKCSGRGVSPVRTQQLCCEIAELKLHG